MSSVTKVEGSVNPVEQKYAYESPANSGDSAIASINREDRYALVQYSTSLRSGSIVIPLDTVRMLVALGEALISDPEMVDLLSTDLPPEEPVE